jgi:hypothetical protein
MSKLLVYISSLNIPIFIYLELPENSCILFQTRKFSFFLLLVKLEINLH